MTRLTLIALAALLAQDPVPEREWIVPDLAVLAVEDEAAAQFFDRRVDVFGCRILASRRVPEAKLLHAAHVLAQYIDNDEDGVPDDEKVAGWLADNTATLVMFDSARRMDRSGLFETDLLDDIVGQDNHADETHPGGRGGKIPFDATLEEVWHLVSNGWEAVYEKDFGYRAGSRLCDAMDKARGGRFKRIPRRYPEGAWYSYDDRTCDYGCMAAEYFYWTLTSLLGAQTHPLRQREIAREWRAPTAALLAEKDPAVFSLLTDELFSLPRTLPDGTYRSDPPEDESD